MAHGEESDEDLDERERRRAADYLDFRRKFDQMKQKHSSQQADSDKMRIQGNNFFSFGCYQQACMCYGEAIELQPENPVLFCNRAMAYIKLEMPELALADAEMSLGLDPSEKNIKAYWRQAQALLDLGRSDESEAVADAGLALEASNQHLNRVRRKAREASAIRRLSSTEWLATLENGVEKRLSFTADGIMNMHVWGHKVPATFELSVEGKPRSMVVRMKPEGNVAGTGPPPPPVPYIYEFHDDDKELWLCHPVGSADLPTKFEGPGFERLRSVPRVAPLAETDVPLDVRCVQYMERLRDLLPLLPQQLPERPSDEQVREEVQLVEQLAKLRQSFGMEVAQRAMELAKEPSTASNADLCDLATALQQRLVARRIIPLPKQSESKPDRPKAASPATATRPPTAPDSAGCLGRIVTKLCGQR
mmetsp:Transcript_40780/g.89133  ORF Transcript_40780/g.89133 Transcript_40780/m.89133 type:complete len:420 (+) Transcript_40780:73-1332(+)